MAGDVMVSYDEIKGADGGVDEMSVRKKYNKLTNDLIEKKLMITTMESCTSGQIASLITDTEGSSAVMKGACITYSNEAKVMEEKQEPIRAGTRLPVAVMLALCAAGALFMEVFISDIQSSHETAVIAHRAGGILAAENSLEGLEEAISHGAYGSEIDVQRTSDGHYVINHDSTFSRLCGVSKKASEMTLEEIRQLTITDSSGGETMTAKIPTLEEMLDTCGDRCVLFIELKGETAEAE